MIISEAANKLMNILEVDGNRYPLQTAFDHIGEALQYLSRDVDVRMNEGVVGMQIPTSGEINTTSLVHDGLQFEYATKIWTFTSAAVQNGLDPTDWVATELTPLTEWLDFDSFMYEYRTYETGTPEAFCDYGGKLYVRPWPDTTTYARIYYRGVPPLDSTGDEPFWMRVAPWAVIYRAAMIACVWLEDESRIPVYQGLLEQQLMSVNIADSMRGDAPLESQEV